MNYALEHSNDPHDGYKFDESRTVFQVYCRDMWDASGYRPCKQGRLNAARIFLELLASQTVGDMVIYDRTYGRHRKIGDTHFGAFANSPDHVLIDKAKKLHHSSSNVTELMTH